MRTAFKVGGTIVSALATIGFQVLNIGQVASLFGLVFDWRWFTLVSSIFFFSFVAWWTGGLESYKRRIENSKPNLVFSEYREYPLFVVNTGQPIYHALQVWFKNKPRIPTDDSVAKDVTAKVIFYDRKTRGKLEIYGCFIKAEAFDFAGNVEFLEKIDNWSPNDEPRKLQISLKWLGDESAYGFAIGGLIASKGDGRELAKEIKKGTHYVKVELKGIRVDQAPFWFILENPGQKGVLSLTDPIKKPDLYKEGFQT